MTLSPVSTRMRFLRILPAVWAIISWPFCRSTRKVALGSNSLTVPSNSSNSSLAIRPLQNATGKVCSGFPSRGATLKCRLQRPGDCTETGENQGISTKTRCDLAPERVPHGTVCGPALLGGAFERRRVGGMPIFDRDGPVPVPGTVLGLGRQCHDQIET